MKKNHLLAKGNRVRISKKSRYYCDDISSNPKGVTGTIERVDPKESHCYSVKWDNGETNAYREGDLCLYNTSSQMLVVGDRVRISKDSAYYRRNMESNPRNTTGTVKNVDMTQEYCYLVEWDNGKKNSYITGDLYIFEDGCEGELIVSKEFLLAAYNAACADWKQRLEGEFPEVFETDKYPTLIDLNKGDQVYSAELYVRIEGADGKTRYQPLNGVQIADGIADDHTLPVNAKYKALYFTDKAVGYGKYEIKHKPTGVSGGGAHVVYFEKK
jgi:hypothetical protein